MAVIVDSFGKDIFIGDKRVGYIGRNELVINNHKFCDLTDDGILKYGEIEIGYIDDTNAIIVKDEEVGYIDDKNNFVFYSIFKIN